MLAWLRPRLPLLWVLLSALLFAIHKLTIKLLTDHGATGTAYPSACAQGFWLFAISLGVMWRDNALSPSWFGPSLKVKLLLTARSLCGFAGLSFGLLAVSKLPVGDATVLVMLSPCFASVSAHLFLREAFGRVELAATVTSLVGAVLVVRPSFLGFGSGSGAVTDGTGLGDCNTPCWNSDIAQAVSIARFRR